MAKMGQNGLSSVPYRVAEGASTDKSARVVGSGLKVLVTAGKKFTANHFSFWLSKVPRSLGWFFPGFAAVSCYLCSRAICAIGSVRGCSSVTNVITQTLRATVVTSSFPCLFVFSSLFPYCYSWQLGCRECVRLDRPVLTQVAQRMQRGKRKNRRQDGREVQGVTARSGALPNWSLRKRSH